MESRVRTNESGRNKFLIIRDEDVGELIMHMVDFNNLQKKLVSKQDGEGGDCFPRL